MAGLAEADTLRTRWRTGNHVGSAKPSMKVLIRKVRIRRHFVTVGKDNIYCFIPGTGPPNRVYQGYLEVHSNFEELPNVQEVNIDHDFGQNGIAQATIVMDNVYYRQVSGVAGLYHVIERGWFSPFRGYSPTNPNTNFQLPATAASKNAWYEKVREKSTQIVILMGYGDAKVPVFSGLLNDTDLTVKPDKITVTARDFGQLFSDQRAFAWAKHPKVLDPITFCDRLSADKVTHEGTGARASSNPSSHPPRFALDDDDNTYWKSGGNSHNGAQEWISFKVPRGRYASIRLQPLYAKMTCYISIYKKNDAHWVDQGKGYTAAGIPWIKMIPEVKMGRNDYSLGNDFELGDDSTIRLTFTNLRYDHHSAGVKEMDAAKRVTSKEAKANKWILVDDASDVVKTVLQWLGFDDQYEVESTGVRLKDKLVFNRQTTFMEIITKIAEMCNYVFYVRPPDDFDENSPDNEVQSTMGVAIFRRNNAMPENPINTPMREVEAIRDDTLMTGIEAKFTDEPLAQHIRVRGKELPKKKGGRTLGADRTHRYMAGYLPPWARSDDIGNGGVKKVVVHYDQLLDSYQDCVIAAMFIAFREALESAKASIQCPALPFIHLDHQTFIYDRASGLSTRLWIAQKTLTFRTGEDGHFTMTLGGSLLDFPDLVAIRYELARALSDAGYNPAPLPNTFFDNPTFI